MDPVNFDNINLINKYKRELIKNVINNALKEQRNKNQKATYQKANAGLDRTENRKFPQGPKGPRKLI